MDTRDKIIETPPIGAALPETAGALFVVAWFDPMLAAHAIRMAELSASGRPLVVVIADPPDPILPPRARAELAASLETVARVVLPPNLEWLDAIAPDCIADERETERHMRQDLARHIHARHQVPG